MSFRIAPALLALPCMAWLAACDQQASSTTAPPAPASPEGQVLAGRVLKVGSDTQGQASVNVQAIDTTTGKVVGQACTKPDGSFEMVVPELDKGLSLSAVVGEEAGAVRTFQPGKPVVLDLETLRLDTISLPSWKDWKVLSVHTEGLDVSGVILGDSWVVRVPSSGDVRLVAELSGPDGLRMTIRISLRRTTEETIPVVPTIDPDRTPGLLSLWTFDSWSGSTIPNQVAKAPALNGTPTDLVLGADGKALLPSKGTHPSTADIAAFGPGTAGVTYLARVFLDTYPSASLHNGRAVVMGQYDGFRILVTNDGRLQVAGQRGDGSFWSWYAPQSQPGVVPLGQWVEIGLAADVKNAELTAYVDGKPIQLFSGVAVDGDQLRDGLRDFVVGADAVDGQEFPGKIDEVRILEGLPLGTGPKVRIGSGSNLFFTPNTNTIAHWGFDFWSNGQIIDETGHGYSLLGDKSGLVSSSFGMAWNGAVSSQFDGGITPELGLSGQGVLRYETRVKLDAYPSASLHNGRAVVMGFYAGPKILVTNDGRIQVGGQRGNGTSWSWYAPQSEAGKVPLKAWTTLAMEADPATATFRAWVDGVEVKLTSGVEVAGTLLRPAYGNFVVGADAEDGQDFPGLIDEARVLLIP
jgi:hypothetical protein